MHPIWFVKWLWERFCGVDVLVPPLENNQGTLSLAALSLALIAFLVENRRAHTAKAEAQAAEDRLAQAARTAEAERRQYEFETQRQDAEARRVAEIDQRLVRMAAFTKTANGVILSVERTVVDDLNTAIAAMAHSEKVLFPSAETRKAASVAAGALMAIIPAAPLNADLITDIRRVAFELEFLSGEMTGVYQGQGAVDWLRERKDQLIKFVQDISEHNIVLTSLLRPTPYSVASELEFLATSEAVARPPEQLPY